jgi:Cu/Ag efflux pump CusA
MTPAHRSAQAGFSGNLMGLGAIDFGLIVDLIQRPRLE